MTHVQRRPSADPGPPVDEIRLSVAAAARRLGIAPASLRTWDRRYGIGPTDHTPGSHRRYSAADVARLEAMRLALARGATPADAAAHALASRAPAAVGAPVPAEHGIPVGPDELYRTVHDAAPHEIRTDVARALMDNGAPAARPSRAGGGPLRMADAGPAARGLARAALALDAATVRAVLAESITAAGIQATWDDVVRPVLVAVAERWFDTTTGIEIEHLLSDCVSAVFGMIAAAAPVAAGARPVLLAGMPGEQHVLPMVVLSATLAQRGVACRSLGSDLPSASLVAAVRRTAPAALVLWSQLPSSADPDVLLSLPRTRPRFQTFVAGPGWTGLALPPQVTRLGSLVEATDVISSVAVR